MSTVNIENYSEGGTSTYLRWVTLRRVPKPFRNYSDNYEIKSGQAYNLRLASYIASAHTLLEPFSSGPQALRNRQSSFSDLRGHVKVLLRDIRKSE